MGYYTKFEIQASPEAIELLEQYSGYEFYQESNISYTLDSAKWYSNRKDCKRVSKELSCGIVVSGEGEERGDYWKAEYEQGEEKYYKGKVSIEYVLVE